MIESEEKEAFLKSIIDVVRSGCGFNPLVGSGVSAASGILMGKEFQDYLAYVVREAVKEHDDPWDLRRNGWPEIPNSDEYASARQWTSRTFRDLFSRDYEIVPQKRASRVRSIRPKSPMSLADSLDCPPVPLNIRSETFSPFDAKLLQVEASLRRGHRRREPYEPLWPAADRSPTSRRWLLELALRSLADWRATLRFLSRLKKEPGRVVLSRADSTVIDRFNTFITAERHPNLTHKMLAALSRPLRMRTVLTTNFDTLLETAFTQASHPLMKFRVSTRGRLPDPFLVRAQPSIIKLHGELLETRADFTLDREPLRIDKRRFFRYFVDVTPDTRRQNSMLSHMLAIGFSGYDLRIIRMIQHLLDESAHFDTKDQPKVFWIAVSAGSAARVRTMFKDYGKRVVVYRTDRPDLLLLELYQRLTCSLPAAGQSYEYTHGVPPYRTSHAAFDMGLEKKLPIIREIAKKILREERTDVDGVNIQRDHLARWAGHELHRRFFAEPHALSAKSENYFTINSLAETCQLLETADPHAARIWCPVSFACASTGTPVLFFNSVCGALESMSILHAKLRQVAGHHPLWFELADYPDADGFIRDVLRTLALKSGRFQREHVVLHPLEKPMLDPKCDVNSALTSLAEYLKRSCNTHRLTPRNFPILIYARDPAGSCVGWESIPWGREDWTALQIPILALARAGFPIVLARTCRNRIEGEGEKLRRALDFSVARVVPRWTDGGAKKTLDEYVTYSDLSRDLKADGDAKVQSREELPSYLGDTVERCPKLSVFHETFKTLLASCDEKPGFRRFLYACSLFRQSRRPSALFYEAVQKCPARFQLRGVDNDWLRSIEAQKHVKKLEAQRVFFLKAGGTSWMHRDMRIALQEALAREPYVPDPHEADGETRAFCFDAARTHFWIGDWYEKAFYSTGHFKPVAESLHHRFQSAKLARFALPAGMSPDGHGLAVRQNRFLLFRSALNHISKTLMIARPHIKLWLANLHGNPMFAEPNKLFKDLVEETSAFCKFSADEEGELKACLEFLSAVIEDTQRAIQNEADLGVSGQLPTYQTPMDSQLPSPIGSALGEMTKAVYEQVGDWDSKVRALHDAVQKDCFSINTGSGSKAETAYRKCLPCGADHPCIPEGEYAESKGTLIQAMMPRLAMLPAFLVALEVTAYAQLRRAKFMGHSGDKDAWRREKERCEWLKVTRLCNLGIDWCKHLPPHLLRLDADLRVRLHSYYAVALANLDRFFEAHRHLTEAAGIQSKQETSASRVDGAKLGLRRAEVLLTEAHRVAHVASTLNDFDSSDSIRGWLSKRGGLEFEKRNECEEPLLEAHASQFLVRIHRSAQECIEATEDCAGDGATDAVVSLRRLLSATLDDAWIAIENAEREMSGHTQSALWWGRVALMKLRACGYQRYLWTPQKDEDGNVTGYLNTELRMASYRHRRINPQVIEHLYDVADLNNITDDYRKFRLIRYAAECLSVFAARKDEMVVVQRMYGCLMDSYSKSKGNCGKFWNVAEKARVALEEAASIINNAARSFAVG